MIFINISKSNTLDENSKRKNGSNKNHKTSTPLKAQLTPPLTSAKTTAKPTVETNSIKQKSTMNILIPAYFHSRIYWDRMIKMSQTYPNRIYAIVNPNNGPGDSINADYGRIFTDFTKASGKYIGYVSTKYGNRNINEIKSDIDKWYSFYSPNGIFFDEQTNKEGYEDYYQEIYNYTKSKNQNSIIIGNAGTGTFESYIANSKGKVTDVICIFESESEKFDSWAAKKWYFKYPSNHFYVLTYNTPISKYKEYIDKAVTNNANWIYCTNDTHDNPWDTLPDYFEEFCKYVISK